jgi:hypothetical protein
MIEFNNVHVIASRLAGVTALLGHELHKSAFLLTKWHVSAPMGFASSKQLLARVFLVRMSVQPEFNLGMIMPPNSNFPDISIV